MNVLGLLAFSVLMAAVLYLHFYFAHYQWRSVKGHQPSDIDSGYVKREDYFAQSFRSKVVSWLELPGSGSPQDGGRIIIKGRETIQVNSRLQLADNAKSDHILVVDGDFACGASCVLSREIRTAGKAEIGPKSRLQAIAADGDLSLGERVRVARWADSRGELRVGPYCVILSRVTSQKAVILSLGAEALSAFAPEVSSAEDDTIGGWTASPSEAEPFPIPPPDSMSGSLLKNLGFDREKLSPLGEECWVYAGSLKPLAPFRLTSKLVVKGDCACPAGSVLEADLKACGSLSVGGDSECRGNLIADKWLYIGPGTRFSGVLHAEGEVLLSRRVRGEAERALVGVHAGGALYLEGRVTVRGILSGGERVRVIPARAADNWRRRHKADRVSE